VLNTDNWSKSLWNLCSLKQKENRFIKLALKDFLPDLPISESNARDQKDTGNTNQPWANWWRKWNKLRKKEKLKSDVKLYSQILIEKGRSWQSYQKFPPDKRKTTITFSHLHRIQVQLLVHIQIHEKKSFNLTFP
jgi:hypothetical protein